MNEKHKKEYGNISDLFITVFTLQNSLDEREGFPAGKADLKAFALVILIPRLKEARYNIPLQYESLT